MTRGRKAALDGALKGMFKALEARGVPEHVRTTVERLAAQAEAPAADADEVRLRAGAKR